MGAADSQPAVAHPAGNGRATPHTTGPHRNQFVLIATAPPGVGKESLMGTFISENAGSVGYCARVGSVRANEPGLLYFYASTADPSANFSGPDTYATILQAMQSVLRDGKSVVVDTDVEGVRALREANVPGVYVFILPASMQALRDSIEESYRGRPNAAKQVEQVVAFSEREIVAMDQKGLYDYAVQNEDDAKAMEQLSTCLRDAYVADRVLALDGGESALRNQDPFAAGRVITAAIRRSGSVHLLPNPTNDLHAGDTTAIGMERWRGCVAVVTGASSGIGWAVCESLISAGMRVVAAARRRERLEALQRAVLDAGAGGRMFLPVMCDVTKEAEVRTLVNLASKTFEGRPVAVLVNCAGVGRTDATLMDGASAAWIDMLSTNVLAVAMCCREACRNMRAAGRWGHIINVCSMSGHRVPQGIGAGGFYAGTKHAVRAMTEGLRQEARSEGVPLRVSLVSPGVVHTEFFAAMSKDDPAVTQRYADAPGLEAADVAATVEYMLASPQHMEIHDVLMRPTEQLV